MPEWGRKHLQPALDGDPEAAASLIFAAGNAQRGEVVKCLWYLDVTDAVLRSALDDAWNHDHAHVWNALHLDKLGRVFKAANFPVDHLPEEFTIWRGTRLKPGDFDIGISWTRNRDIACWFAYRFRSVAAGDPLVLRRTVRRDDVLAHIEGRREDEIIVMPARYEVDSNVEDWERSAKRYQAEKEARQKAYLA